MKRFLQAPGHIPLAFLWLLSSGLSLVQCSPYILLVNGGSKCLTVDANRNSIVTVEYHAPDLIVDTDKNEATSENASDEAKDKKKKKQINKRSQEMNILMYHREQDMGFSHHHRKASGGTQKLRQTLEQQRGRVEFLTGDADGLIEICPQAYGATRLNPSRISLKVTSQSEVSDDQKAARKLLKQQGPSLEEEFLVKAQGSQITQELQRMEEKVYELISNSESSKEREVDFHNQCVKLNRAVGYWPVFRILILLVAGYMQASHVIRFMKARHIH